MDRAPGLSVRLKLTLSYAGFLMVAGVLLLATVWVFLLRYVPDQASVGPGPFSPTRSDMQKAFTPRAAQSLAFLLLFGLVGGWILAGRMLAPLTRKQFAVLEVLVAAQGGVVSAEELLARAWDENADPFTNAVRITVSQLRKRLGEPWIIATVAGVGYRIDTQPDTGCGEQDRG